MARVLLLVVIALLLQSCGSKEKDTLLAKVNETRTKMAHVEGRAGPSDTDVLALVARTKGRLETIEDMIIENRFDEAEELLTLTDRSLTRFLEQGTLDIKAPSQPLRIFGRVTYRTKNDDSDRDLEENENPRRITSIRTGVRSGAYLELTSTVSVQLASEAELGIEPIRAPDKVYVFDLVSGAVNLEIETGTRVALILGSRRLEIRGPASIDTANLALTDTRLLSVFRGRVTWREGQETRELSDLQGLRWTGDEARETSLPGRPRPSTPEDNATIYTGGEDTGGITIEWTAGIPGKVQLQVSDEPFFFTRVFDRQNLDDNHRLRLSPGTYYWRVRSFTDHRLPGPYTKTQRFSVSRGSGPQQAAGTTGKPKGEGPPIENVEVEIFKPTMMITGKTVSGARVRVNGEGASVMKDGTFHSLIDVVSGKQKLRIEATDLRTGFTRVWEKEIDVP